MSAVVPLAPVAPEGDCAAEPGTSPTIGANSSVVARDENTVIALAPAGDNATTAVVERYYVDRNALVQAGDPIALLRTSRYVYDLPALQNGIVADFLVPVGGDVRIGAPLLVLTPSQPATAPIAERAEAARKLRISPLARSIARAHGMDLEQLQGSVPDGRIRASDILGLVPREPTECAPGMRDALHFVTSRTAPPAAINTVIDPTHVHSSPHAAAPPRALAAFDLVLEPRARHPASPERQLMRRGIAVTPATRVLHAAIATLLICPELNSRWSNAGIVIHRHLRLGISFDGTTIGLLVANAFDFSLVGLARRLNTRVAQSHTPPRMDEPTFAVCFASGNVYWSEPSLPVACGCILTIGAPRLVPTVGERSGNPEIVARQRAIVTLAYDARYVLPQEAARFLQSLRDAIEHKTGAVID